MLAAWARTDLAVAFLSTLSLSLSLFIALHLSSLMIIVAISLHASVLNKRVPRFFQTDQESAGNRCVRTPGKRMPLARLVLKRWWEDDLHSETGLVNCSSESALQNGDQGEWTFEIRTTERMFNLRGTLIGERRLFLIRPGGKRVTCQCREICM